MHVNIRTATITLDTEYKSGQACKRAAIHTHMHLGMLFKYVPELVAVLAVQVRPA